MEDVKYLDLDGLRYLASKINDKYVQKVAAKREIAAATTAWLEENVIGSSTPIVIDKSLQIEGAAADAKATGTLLSDVAQDIEELGLALGTVVDGGYVEDGVAYFTHDGNVVFQIAGINDDEDKVSLSVFLLTHEVIPRTVQRYTFGSDGSIQKIEHVQDNQVIRTDVFTFGENVVTEVRTLNTGESLTIVTNLTTMETTTTYTEGLTDGN